MAIEMDHLLGVPWAESGVGRIKAVGLPYRSSPHGPVDTRINTDHGGCIVYRSEPDRHVWELLTVSYARARS